MIRRTFRNPQGLNEILSEILGYSVSGDWDENFPSEIYVGRWKKEKVKGKTSQEWGARLEDYACSYLAKKLKIAGWELFHKRKIGENEYDCVGWKGKPKDKQSPDLVIEMYFPIPKGEPEYEFEYVRKKTDQMVRRLGRINAEMKYVVIGVPCDRKITTLEIPRPGIKVVYQEYKFTKVRLEKRKNR